MIARATDHSPPARLKRVVLRNYRSIEACDVQLGPLTFLVGPNGSGKSNFLDALRLLTDSLRSSLDHALRDRGGIQAVRRRSSGHPTHFGIRVDFEVPDGQLGHFAFDVAARSPGGYAIKTEECRVGSHYYRVADGKLVIPPADVSPPAASDRLYLVNAAGLPSFRPVFDLLSSMGFYSLNPEQIRALQAPDKGELLARDGHNLASVMSRLKTNAEIKTRIEEYLSNIVPGIEGVDQIGVGHMETLEFRQRVQGAQYPWKFNAINMSDGTLRALGILVALFQARVERKIPVIGIEEPEAALHPAAAGLLRDALRDGARSVQVVVTSHSPELLDDERISDSEIIAVINNEGTTQMGHLDQAGRSALRDRLFTAGELLRSNDLTPDPEALPDAAQLRLFEADEP